ncbi:hypothetical protein [Thermococcus barophilus]|uniref:Lipoprotein n=1 Tax=Thermococcus barophilus (strain DSM 11836 / MP) TaxID=391623 RepID=F0LI53_THEBM|nr:hypothetical protein [Thermococcus barophilus]ADT83207.1 hypothetical protein TERMP_00230 [Thermococcus barophilus MP]
MKKVLGLLVAVILIMSFSGCLQGSKPPTKETILQAIDSVDTYTYEKKMIMRYPSLTRVVYIYSGINRQEKQFFELLEINATYSNGQFQRTKMLQYFDGSKNYVKMETNENGKETNGAWAFTINDIYKAYEQYYPDLPRDQVLNKFIESRDEILNVKDLLSKANITEITKKGDRYEIKFVLYRQYISTPSILQSYPGNASEVQEYMNVMRKLVRENIAGVLLVDKDGKPLLLKMKSNAKITYLYSNETIDATGDYTIKFSYEYNPPKWAEDLKRIKK